MALTRTIKGVKHYAYESKEEFRKAHPDTLLITNWKKAEEGDWCLADDGKIVQILKKGAFAHKTRKETPYARTVIGMFNLQNSGSFLGTVKDEIYRFTKKSDYETKKGGHLTDAKRNFAKYVAHGMEPVEAFQKAFPNANNLEYAEVGITKRYLLETTKDVIDKTEVRDNDKLRAIETLMKISGLLSTEKKVDSVALIQEFSGFSREKLKAFEQGILPEKQKELSE